MKSNNNILMRKIFYEESSMHGNHYKLIKIKKKIILWSYHVSLYRNSFLGDTFLGLYNNMLN